MKLWTMDENKEWNVRGRRAREKWEKESTIRSIGILETRTINVIVFDHGQVFL